jgi:hypothetical protein
MLPRLPMELPLPARAKASPGVTAKARTATAATTRFLRRMGFRFSETGNDMVIDLGQA